MPSGGHSKSGPAPADADVRAIRGGRTRKRHRERESALVVSIGVPAKPKHLGVYGSTEWNRLTRFLTLEGRLTEADRPCLEIAASAYDSARSMLAAREAQTAGSEEWTRLARSERLSWQLYVKALADLCLTPSTRARAPKPPRAAHSENKLRTFLDKKFGPRK